ALVSLDGAEVRRIPALLIEHRWNGWECPYFLPEDLRDNRAQFEKYAELVAGGEDSVSVSWNEKLDLPSIITFTEDEPDGYEEVSVVSHRGGEPALVTIGWGFFTWEEVRADG